MAREYHIMGMLPAAPPPDTDPYFSNVVTLLHFDEANGVHVPVCVKGKIWSYYNDAVMSTASPLVGTASGVLDGVGDGFYSNDGITSFNLGSGDFTIEQSFSLASLPTPGQFMMLFARYNTSGGVGQKSYECAITNTGAAYRIDLYGSSDGVTDNGVWTFNMGFTPTTNTKYDLALVRSGGSLYCFINGNQIGSTQAISFTFYGAGSSELQLGTVTGGGSTPLMFPFHGKFDEFRMTIPVARYTANYTVSHPFPDS